VLVEVREARMAARAANAQLADERSGKMEAVAKCPVRMVPAVKRESCLRVDAARVDAAL